MANEVEVIDMLTEMVNELSLIHHMESRIESLTLDEYGTMGLSAFHAKILLRMKLCLEKLSQSV